MGRKNSQAKQAVAITQFLCNDVIYICLFIMPHMQLYTHTKGFEVTHYLCCYHKMQCC